VEQWHWILLKAGSYVGMPISGWAIYREFYSFFANIRQIGRCILGSFDEQLSHSHDVFHDNRNDRRPPFGSPLAWVMTHQRHDRRSPCATAKSG
jgi:hypothetical protein